MNENYPKNTLQIIQDKYGNPLVISNNGAHIRLGSKVGRNSLCDCGSGKKFKNCCAHKGIKPEEELNCEH